MNRSMIFFMLMLMASTVFGASSSETDRLNFFDSATHTVVLYNDEGGAVDMNATMPTGWTFGASSDCTDSGQDVICLGIADGAYAVFTMVSPAAQVEYSTHVLDEIHAGATVIPDITFVNIKESEVFLTLVEYGRGKGNYFYSSQGKGGSGQEETGYGYIPATTDFELSYLHKVYPSITNYLGVPLAEGSDLNIHCSYPNDTMTKKHLATALTIGATAELDYSADLLTSSWERLFYVTQVFDSGDYADGQNFTVNCTEISFTLADAYGNVSVDEDSFVLVFDTVTPVAIDVMSVSPTVIGTGTSEVEVNFQITNMASYPLSVSTEPMYVRIESGSYCDWIGVRGELWGEGKDYYDFEIKDLDTGYTSYVTTLVARCDTTGGSPAQIDIAGDAKITFVPTWEIMSYHPIALRQTVTIGTKNITVSGSAAAIVGVQDTLVSIESKIDSIQYSLAQINETIQSNAVYLNTINNTVTTIAADVVVIDTEVGNIQTDVTSIIEDLDCDGVSDTPMCDRLLEINVTTQAMSLVIDTINTNLNNNMSAVFAQFNQIQTNFSDVFTDIDVMQSYLNCQVNSQDSICWRLSLIENNTLTINSTITNNYDLLQYINNTWLPSINLTASVSVDLTPVLTKIRQLREFEEESIYLVTDAMVSANDNAIQAMNDGNIEAATRYMAETQEQMNILSVKLDSINTADPGVLSGTKTALMGIVSWIMGLWPF